MAGLSYRTFTHRTVGLSLLAALLYCGVASAQENDRGFGFLEQLFGNSDRTASEPAPGAAPDRGPATGRVAQSGGDLTMRLDRLEAQIRQLTGAIEQLQYRNQQLEGQLRRMQQDAEYRIQDGGARAAPSGRPVAPAQPQPPYSQPQATQPYSSPPAAGGRRGDAFDPSLNPNAPGAPRPLGTTAPSAPLASAPLASAPLASAPLPQGPDPEDAVGAPGGRAAGAPLDLSTITGLAGAADTEAASRNPDRSNPDRSNPDRGGAQVATLPPSSSPKDTYDLAYGYILRKDYALADESFRLFLRHYPNDRLAADAQYWLAESLFQRQRYRDAAEIFLNVSTKFETAAKAPDSLLRLGQALAALGEKEAACASLAEVGRKYPRASVSVKQGVDREQKRVRC
jgi:tol-pal system protein YbgF